MKHDPSLAKRARRHRYRLKKFGGGKLRLSVYRSNRHLQAQIIDDTASKTVVACSTMEKELRGQLKSTSNIAAATMLGQVLATRAKQAGITTVMFDRGGYKYHGRIKAVAESLRANGMQC
ncbi:MAG: 50S ribosomal protein L18 [Alphaproteobacteria bacterium]|nr:50S ribosomal protein L18 [Alphaproteobacteria bacterium]